MKTVLLLVGLFASSVLTAQVNSDANQPTPAPQPVPPCQRPVSLGRIIPNIVDALDSHDAPYFRSTSTFAGFNSAFTGNATAIGTAIVPVSLYATGLISKDSKMKGAALLAGEAVADSEILTFVLKDAFKRVRPTSISPMSTFSDTWFESRGSLLGSSGCTPSGHAIAAFSVGTLSAHFVSDVFVGGALGYSVSRFAVLQQ
jgi:membrane-associated phospholipid phosphatase